MDVPQYDGTYLSDLCTPPARTSGSSRNTLNLPLLMVLETPDAVRYTHTWSQDPNFTGGLSAAGPVVPAPFPGALKWDYPFMNPDGTVKPVIPPSRSQPAPTTQP